MAWIKNQKADSVADDAQRAITEGRQVFAVRFYTPTITGGAGVRRDVGGAARGG